MAYYGNELNIRNDTGKRKINENNMENLDIKDFQSVSAVADADNVLLARSGGTHGKMRVSLFKQAVMQGLTPKIQGGVWYVGDTSTGVQAKGKTPVLETGTVQTLQPGSAATFSVVANGTDSSGNPKYKVNAGIPKGEPGKDGQGTGNVKVTNATQLLANTRYVFMPSAKGSAEGTFSTISTASSTADGLMKAADYAKLAGMKDVWAVPLAVASLTDQSTSEEIEKAFGMDIQQLGVIVYHAAILQKDYQTSLAPKTYIGNHECLLSGSTEMDSSGGQASSATLDFNYVDGGRLHTISITVRTSDFTCSCKVSESGGTNEYYLPTEVCNLSESSTPEQVFNAFGGKDGIDSLTKAMNANANIYIKTTLYNIPVSCSNILGILVYVSFLHPQKGLMVVNVGSSGTANNKAMVFDISKNRDYILPASFCSLSSSSKSADISTVFGGVNGFKAMGQAMKDGRAVRISGKNGQYVSFPASVTYDDSDSSSIGAYISYTASDTSYTCVVTCTTATGTFVFAKM